MGKYYINVLSLFKSYMDQITTTQLYLFDKNIVSFIDYIQTLLFEKTDRYIQ